MISLFWKIKKIFINKANKNRRVMSKFAQFVNIDNKPVYVKKENVETFGPEPYGDTLAIAIHTKGGNTVFVKDSLETVLHELNTVEVATLLND